jgi:hypothetical protein
MQLLRCGGEAALAGDGIQYQKSIQGDLHGLLSGSEITLKS